MDIWNHLSPELRDFLFAAATDATGGLIGGFVESLLRSGGRRVRERFAKPETEQALERAAGAAITGVISDWQVAHPDYADLWARFGDWLLNPAVLTEFRILLTPSADAAFDMELLRDEFEAAGLEVAHLDDADFDGLIQEMVGEFYTVAATEAALQGPLEIGLLRQMAHQMGALERLAARQNDLSRRSLGQLEQLTVIATDVADGIRNLGELLNVMSSLLADRQVDTVQLQTLYAANANALTRAGYGDLIDGQVHSAQNVAIGHHITMEVSQDLTQVLAVLTEIRNSVMAAQSKMTTTELAAMERNYRQRLVDQFEKLTFRGITPSGTALSLKLADVYVELKAVADIPEAADTYSADERRLLLEAHERGEGAHGETVARLDALRLERWRADARRAREEGNRFQRRSIGDIVADPRQRGLVILGDPGSGKSTLLHYLALTQAGDPQPPKAAALLEKPLPIFAPLAAYDDHLRRTKEDLPLGDFLALYYEKWRNLPGLEPLFAAALEQGRALVLLDGLDEVLETATRQFVAEQAGALIQRWQGRGNRFVVTSRVVGYREARLPGDLPHVTVLDFGRPEIETFAHQWCRAYEVWAAGRETPTALQQAAAEETALLEDVRSNPSVEGLAANPLLLTMLALLRRQVGKLPDRRVELYERYTRTLIDNREQERSRGARQQAPSRFDPHRAIAHLMDLALWLQMNRPSGTARRVDLEHALVDICLHYDGHETGQVPAKLRVGAQKDAEAFLNDMRHFAGLLGERGRDAFGFLHLTFQEYFAGRALARLNPADRWAILQPRLHLPRWREPILLCAGQLGVIEGRRDLVSDLVGRIANAQSDHEALLQRDLFLAAAAMADDVGITPPLFQTLYERLAALYTSPIPTVQDRALSGLAHLARLGHHPAEKLLLESLANANLQLAVIRNTRPFFEEENGLDFRKAISTKLNDDDSVVRQAAVQAVAGLVSSDASVRESILTKLNDDDSVVRQAAVQAVAGLVSSDASVRESILTKLNDQNDPLGYVRQAAVQALAGLVSSDATVCDAILTKLNDEQGDVRQAAVQAMAGLVSSNATVRESILTKLSAGIGPVRQAAVQVLAELVSSEKQVLADIRRCLDDHDEGVRCAAVEALAGLVNSDEQVLTDIRRCLADHDEDVRRAAVEALAGLVNSDEQVLTDIRRCLADHDEDVRRAAVEVLAGLVNSDEQVLTDIRRCLDDHNEDVRRAAVNTLGGLVNSDEQVLTDIRRCLENKFFYVQVTAIEALAGLVYSNEQVLASIHRCLKDRNAWVRQAAVKALSGLGNSNKQVLAGICECLKDRKDWVRQAAIQALVGLVSTDKDVRQAIMTKLNDENDPNGFVRQAAIQALAGLVSTDKDVRQAIMAKLNDESDKWTYVRQAAIQALVGLVSTDKDVRQAIMAKLNDENDPNGFVRQAAIQALAGLVSTDKDVRQAIMAKLNDESDPLGYVRQAAVQALAGLVSTDKDVRQAIMAKLNDESDPLGCVLQAVVQALAGAMNTITDIRQAIVVKLTDDRSSLRYAAVEALAGLVDSDEQVLADIRKCLDDHDEGVRYAAVKALAGLVNRDTDIRQVIITRFSDDDPDVRCAAGQALAELVSTEPTILNLFLNKLRDENGEVRLTVINALKTVISYNKSAKNAVLKSLFDEDDYVRRVAVNVLILLIDQDQKVQDILLPWLGITFDEYAWRSEEDTPESIKRKLVAHYSVQIKTNKKLKKKIVTMLNSVSSSTRNGAAKVLIAASEPLPLDLLNKLQNLLYDTREEENWPNRLQIAELFINDRNCELSQYSIRLVVEALDYATQPWYNLPSSGSAVRKQATMILGQLDPLYRDDKVFAKLTQVMQNDKDPDVRDAAYGALLRLAAAPEPATAV